MKIRNNWILGLMIIMITAISGCSTADDDPDAGDSRDKYLGEWQVTETNSRLNYRVTITKDPMNSSNIVLDNFADSGTKATGLVIDNNVEMPEQTIGENWTLKNASGSRDAVNLLTFRFDLVIDGNTTNHNATFTK